MLERNLSSKKINFQTKSSIKGKQQDTSKVPFILPRYEHSRYNLSLYQTTIFPHEHTHRTSSMTKVVLSFRFRPIEFSKKRSLLFFLALELLTSKKAIASLSSRNRQSWKVRKGRLVGCKVTLRKESLYEFIDTLLLTFPRREKLYPFTFSAFNLTGQLKKKIKQGGSVSFRFGELVLFYPIEIAIGLHPDLSYLHRACNFSSLTMEERFFHLRSFAFPLALCISIYYIAIGCL